MVSRFLAPIPVNALSLSELLKTKAPGAVLAAHAWRGDETVTVGPDRLVEVARILKEDPAFQMNFLMDLTAVDYLTFGKTLKGQGAHPSAGIAVRQPMNVPAEESWPDRAVLRPGSGQVPARFEVVYHFFSLPLQRRIRVKVPVEESKAEVESVAAMWAAANWFEREVWDMYGIRFRGHPDLRRLLMYPEFEGHPLRKDYAVSKRQPLIGPVN